MTMEQGYTVVVLKWILFWLVRFLREVREPPRGARAARVPLVIFSCSVNGCHLACLGSDSVDSRALRSWFL